MGSAILTRLDRVLFERIRLWVPLVYLNPCATLTPVADMVGTINSMLHRTLVPTTTLPSDAVEPDFSLLAFSFPPLPQTHHD